MRRNIYSDTIDNKHKEIHNYLPVFTSAIVFLIDRSKVRLTSRYNIDCTEVKISITKTLSLETANFWQSFLKHNASAARYVMVHGLVTLRLNQVTFSFTIVKCCPLQY